jgi:hypothetical protein
MCDPGCRALRHGSSLRATQDQVPRFEVKSHGSSEEKIYGTPQRSNGKACLGKLACPGHSCLDSPWHLNQAGRVLGPATCAVVIPCFNEAASIATLVVAVRRHLPTVLVVDDGSTDDTAALAAPAGATVAGHERNLGKGAALKTGLSRALRQGFEWAFTLDGDGQHALDDLPAFMRCAEQTGALLVVGNRMHNARAIPWLRRRVNRCMSRQLSRRAGQHLPDTQCGFRLIHLATWAALPLKAQRFEVESETLMAFLAAKHPVAFVPIRVIGRGRTSRINPVTDSLRWWKWWRGLDWRSTRPAETRSNRPVSYSDSKAQ